MKKRINREFRQYRVLGACNPPLAHRALSVRLDIGLLMPCNVIVYEKDDGGTMVAAVDPVETIAGKADGDLKQVAEQARQKLGQSLERIKTQD